MDRYSFTIRLVVAVVPVLSLAGCNTDLDGNLKRCRSGDGETAFALGVAIPPHGSGYVLAPDATGTSKELLEGIEESWPHLWPKMISYINEAKEDYHVEVDFDSTFTATVGEIEDGTFMADEAHVMIGIHPSSDAVPVWHFFVRDSEIVHQQPVF